MNDKAGLCEPFVFFNAGFSSMPVFLQCRFGVADLSAILVICWLYTKLTSSRSTGFYALSINCPLWHLLFDLFITYHWQNVSQIIEMRVLPVSNLKIIAGPKAYRHIRNNGLNPDDVSAVFAASGAAKWLSIYGLDRAIFETWLAGRDSPLHLYGTSIGAWKLAAAAERQPGEALERLAVAYMAQVYDKKVKPEVVAEQAVRILDDYLSDGQIDEVLQHPQYKLHIGLIRSKGLLASDHFVRLSLAMLQAALLNVTGRNSLTGLFERVVFSSHPDLLPVFQGDRFRTECHQLENANFRQALLATASIPLVLPAVRSIAGVSDGYYRDGGVLDYHPVPSLMTHFDGLILYPHFYPHLVPGWFDKFYQSRIAPAYLINNVVILAPSPEFVKALPYGRISDRKDFTRLDDGERMRVWQQCVDASLKLGEEFLALAQSGDIAGRVECA
ncbi:MAG: hypothetical protein CSA52_02415 [Gammaproteobacteria bacterium]|nr:MAG: hypothetical protein CSB48_06400 [Pseudomonadota bacterium]PIE38442.1 MAG: hypothetical protein CSA52_02415 [Gammaproteobacteria bacterium]